MMGNEYIVAWIIYCGAGLGGLMVWWRLTSFIASRGTRDILRGLMVVLIYTPWYAGDSPEFFAPAVVVLLMDLLLEGTKSGMKGAVALLFATFFMLLVLTVRQLRRR